MANTGLELGWRAPARLLRSSIARLETLAKKILSAEILSRHPLLLLGLVLGWFYYVFASYLPDL